VSLALWLLLTGLLALYVDRSESFGTTYGPLTGIFAFLFWANPSSVALFSASRSVQARRCSRRLACPGIGGSAGGARQLGGGTERRRVGATTGWQIWSTG
jgi:hypothetical protein